MERHRAGADGRRLFTAEFKQEAVRRVVSGECTVAELSRELGVNQSLLHRWKQRIDGGGAVAVQADEEVVPVSELKAAKQRIKELERALGRKTMEVEILEAARDEIKKKPHWYGVVRK
jgi:transposase